VHVVTTNSYKNSTAFSDLLKQFSHRSWLWSQGGRAFNAAEPNYHGSGVIISELSEVAT